MAAMTAILSVASFLFLLALLFVVLLISSGAL
jgi:hypothetical protein